MGERKDEGMNRREAFKRGAGLVAGFSLGNVLVEVDAAEGDSDEDAVVGFVMDGGPSQAAFFDAKTKLKDQHSTGLTSIETESGLIFGEILQNTSQIAELLTVIRTMESGVEHPHGMRDLLSQRLKNEQRSVIGRTNFHKLIAEKNRQDIFGLVYLRADFPGYGDGLNFIANSCRDDFHKEAFTLPDSFHPDWRGDDGERYHFIKVMRRDDEGAEYEENVALSPPQGRYEPPIGADLLYGIDNLGDKRAMLSEINVFGRTSERIAAHEENARRAFSLVTGNALQGMQWYPPESYLNEVGNDANAQTVWIVSELLRRRAKSLLIRIGHWDTHENEAAYLRKHGPKFDAPFAWLIRQIESGELPPTLVWAAGEFGRSPVVDNIRKGREHHPIQATALYGRRLRKGGFGQTNNQWQPEGKRYPLKHLKDIVWRGSGRGTLNVGVASEHEELFI